MFTLADIIDIVDELSMVIEQLDIHTEYLALIHERLMLIRHQLIYYQEVDTGIKKN